MGNVAVKRQDSTGGKFVVRICCDEAHDAGDHVLSLVLQALSVLAHLHSRKPPAIYRDIKPSNLMILPDRALKMGGFGIARHFQPPQTATRIGTPGYAPPEQYRGSVDPRSDLYGLLVIGGIAVRLLHLDGIGVIHQLPRQKTGLAHSSVTRFCQVLLATAFVIVVASHGVFAFDLDRVLSKDTKVFRLASLSARLPSTRSKRRSRCGCLFPSSSHFLSS